MPLIEWNDKMSVSVEEIDSQHKKLVGIINKLHDALKNNTYDRELKKIYLELVEYTEYHFKTEEMYMEKAGYANLDDHIKQHVKFVERLRRLRNRCNEGTEAISVELSSFLSGWMIRHILHSDKEYSDTVINSSWYVQHKKSA